MALDNISLGNLLQIFAAEGKEQRSLLRKDLAKDRARERAKKKRIEQPDLKSSGSDFYMPFWADAKAHAFEGADLKALTAERIKANWRNKNLYPLLMKGYLDWWNEKRRWRNEPIYPIKGVRSTHEFPDFGRVKIYNILALKANGGFRRIIYPYFPLKPALTPQAARFGLWVLGKSFPTYSIAEMRILDVIRGKSYGVQDLPFEGDEEKRFLEIYGRTLEDWRVLRDNPK